MAHCTPACPQAASASATQGGKTRPLEPPLSTAPVSPALHAPWSAWPTWDLNVGSRTICWVGHLIEESNRIF